MEMKKEYEKPNAEAIDFLPDDSIAVSGQTGAAIWERVWGGNDL